MQTKKRLNPVLSEIDGEVLCFLWRHRIATFRALKDAFFPETSNQSAYYQLRRLRRGEYLKVAKLEGTRRTIWTLGLRGFKFVSANLLPELKAKTFQPQSQYHDLLAAAALTGRWLVNPPPGVELLTEQELRALESSAIPHELRGDDKRRPDGLWIFSSGGKKRAISLEVEISAKTAERYEHIAAYYASELFFESVIWIVKSKSLAEQIHAASTRFGRPREGLHLFILLRDFESRGWDSHFLNKAMAGDTLGEFLDRRARGEIESGVKKRITLESAKNHLGLPREKIDPFLDFKVSLENLSALNATPSRKIP